MSQDDIREERDAAKALLVIEEIQFFTSQRKIY
jgi:hypothetical protein